jgi:hypothetical protein
VVGERVDAPLDDSDDLRVEREVQVRLVPQEPSSDLLGDGTWRLVRRLVGDKF